MKRYILISSLIFLNITIALSKINTKHIEQIIENKKATIGVAIIYQDKVYTIGNNNKYPLMSAFKFHIAVTALNKMAKENIALDSMVCISKEKMHENTYSPLRDKYPDQDIHIPYKEIIKYTVSISDNNTCDFLIDFVGGIENVNSYIRSLGIDDFNFSKTEDDMHRDIMNSYNNWSTPLSMTQLIRKIYTENILSCEYFKFLEQTMLETSSGVDKLRAGLPGNIKLGHKTGHSDRRPDGVQIGEADSGVIYLPNGEKCYITVFIKDSKESDKDNARIMADIAKAVFQSLI